MQQKKKKKKKRKKERSKVVKWNGRVWGECKWEYVLTWVTNCGFDSVTTLEQELDEPWCYVTRCTSYTHYLLCSSTHSLSLSLSTASSFYALGRKRERVCVRQLKLHTNVTHVRDPIYIYIYCLEFVFVFVFISLSLSLSLQ